MLEKNKDFLGMYGEKNKIKKKKRTPFAFQHAIDEPC